MKYLTMTVKNFQGHEKQEKREKLSPAEEDKEDVANEMQKGS